MKVKCTYLQNDKEKPIVYGERTILNPKRKKLRNRPEKDGILAETLLAGFCGTDYELMKMGRNGELGSKFPSGTDRLINGHEGVVWVPSENRHAVVLIRGGNSYDPTRFMEDEDYFEYGCDGADGLFSDCNYYNPDMLLRIPEQYIENGRLPLSIAKRLVFADPYACMLFQLERMEDLGEAHLFRVEMARNNCTEEIARRYARENLFQRTVIFGLGTTGMFIADLIRQKYQDAKILFVGRSDADSKKVQFALEKTGAEYVQSKNCTEQQLAETIVHRLGGKAGVFIAVSGSEVENRIAFAQGVLGCNGIYNSFSLGPKVTYDTMPFGFQNQLVFGSINFRQDHMQRAIELLCQSNYDQIVEFIEKDEFVSDPVDAYENKIYSEAAPLKSAVIWNEKYMDLEG